MFGRSEEETRIWRHYSLVEAIKLWSVVLQNVHIPQDDKKEVDIGDHVLQTAARFYSYIQDGTR